MNVKTIDWEFVDWVYVVQVRYHWQAVVKTVRKLWVP
jgi:hypothetical protein